VSYDGAQSLERGIRLVESLKARGDVQVAKAVEKDVGIERVLRAARRGRRRLHARSWTRHVALLAIPGGGKQWLVAIERRHVDSDERARSGRQRVAEGDEVERLLDRLGLRRYTQDSFRTVDLPLFEPV
jgi:hypothetical protein